MSAPFHLHFVVHGPWEFSWADQGAPRSPGTAVRPEFRDAHTFVNVTLRDRRTEQRTIPCRIARGETAHVYSQAWPEEVPRYTQRKDPLG